MKAVTCQLTGCDGSAPAIMGRVSRALKQAGKSADEIDKYRAAAMSGNYDNLLSVSIEALDDAGIEWE